MFCWSVLQNALDQSLKYPRVVTVVKESFYVDDDLTGANTVKEAIQLQEELQSLFSSGGFLLNKWNSSDPSVLQHIPLHLQDSHSLDLITDSMEYTKTLGIEWNAGLHYFHLAIDNSPAIISNVTKRRLVSDIAKV